MTDFDLNGIGMTSQRTRRRMVERLADRGINDVRVLQAMSEVPRHIFVQEAFQSRAYEDFALSIGEGQTISKPYTVALMCQIMMAVEPKKVLEIGTGCGYQAQVLSLLVPKVYSIERIESLYKKARTTLLHLKSKAHLRFGDGYQGMPIQAPFDAILLAAAPLSIPEALLDQLAPEGILIAPEGKQKQVQQLVCYQKKSHGIERHVVGEAEFVPMLRGTT